MRTAALSEGSFQQLLAAAYVLQQHTDRLINDSKADPSCVRFEIPEIGKVIKTGGSNARASAQIIAERLQTSAFPESELNIARTCDRLNGIEEARVVMPTSNPQCHSCGYHFGDDEFLCGGCGLPRFVSEPADDGSDSKFASLWYLQQTNQAVPGHGQIGQDALHSSVKTSQKRATLSEEQESFPIGETVLNSIARATKPTQSSIGLRMALALEPLTAKGVLDGFNKPAQDEILHDMAELAQVQTGASGAVVALEGNGAMVCRASAGVVAHELGVHIDSTTGLWGACVATGRTQWCVNTDEDPRVDAEAFQLLGVRSLIVTPLFDGEKVVGIFEVISPRPSAFGSRDLQILHEFAGRVTDEIEHRTGKFLEKAPRTESKVPIRQPAPTPRTLPGNVSSIASEVKNRNTNKILLVSLAIMLAMLLLVGVTFYREPQAIRPNNTATTQRANPAGSFIRIKVSERAPIKRGMSRGRLIYTVAPIYPPQALQQRLEGPVLLRAQITKEGLVQKVTAVRGSVLLAEAASEAIRQWRFDPYKLNGKAIDMPAQITIYFGLPK